MSPQNDKKPEQVSVTMYDVGFGDCFLLTFMYAGDEKRHVVIDCGSTSKRKDHMSRVVDQLIEDCKGRVVGVVATHRHKDHISAFGLKDVGEKLATLDPDVVIQPWTEHPDAEEAALEAPSVFTSEAANHMMGLEAAQKFALRLVKYPNRLLSAAKPQTKKYLSKIAELSIPNKKAIMRLTDMGKKKKHAYVHAGGRSGLEGLLPGVRVTVLGPPTLKQSQNIRRQTAWDPDEFWKLYDGLSAKSVSNISTARGDSKLFHNVPTTTISRSPSYVKWVIDKLNTIQLHRVKRIVRALDDAINNTSVILLFEVGNKALLFSGDAQLENWQYALGKSSMKEKLKKTSVYKVGHHGSTNATPKSLWALFQRKGRADHPLISLLSSERGHHHRVPRKSLVEALKAETEFHSTQPWRRRLSETFVV